MNNNLILRRNSVRITELILYKYKRLFLNDIQNLIYKPETNMQIILGQNGSGKSSILGELTPLPANYKKDFKAGGYKKIKIQHNEDTYILTSGPHKYSFVMNNNELNDSGILSIQTKLVFEHFNITPNNQQVILGINKFTTMSPADRKRWLTDISNIDYAYPISVYNNLKQRHRDITGGIKLLHNNILSAEKSSIPDELLESLQSDKTHLETLIDHLLTLINRVPTADDIESRIQHIEDLVKNISADELVVTDSLEKLDILKATAILEQDMVSKILISEYIELNSLSETITTEDIEGMNNTIAAIDTDIESILKINKFSKIKNIESTCDYLNSVYSDIIDLLAPLSEYNGLNISRDNIQYLQNKLDNLNARVQYIDKELHKLEERINHMQKHIDNDDTIECPECNHVWIPSGKATDITTCVEMMTNINKERFLKQEQVSALESELSSIGIVRNILSTFSTYFRSTSDTKDIIKHISDRQQSLDNTHSELYSVFIETYNQVLLLRPIVTLRKDRDLIKDKLDKAKSRESLKLDLAVDYRKKIEDSIEANTNKKESIRNTLLTLSSNIKIKTKYLSSIEELADSLNALYATKKLMIADRKNILLKEAVNKLKMLLLDIDNKLNSNKNYLIRLAGYKDELSELTNKEYLLRLSLEALSPTTGLIAKSISSSIVDFIDSMNEAISVIWNYNMEILPPILEDGDLNYKFKVIVNNDEVIDDIGKTSNSMQELINLVFRMQYMKYKGFGNYPLILDEFGSSFDMDHRISSYSALDVSIASSLGQVFMVSHYVGMYGMFDSADISILGNVGVDMSDISEYNTVMKMH